MHKHILAVFDEVFSHLIKHVLVRILSLLRKVNTKNDRFLIYQVYVLEGRIFLTISEFNKMIKFVINSIRDQYNPTDSHVDFP
jgi:hypothetical protein